MTKKIFRSIILVVATILISSFLIIVGFLYRYFSGVFIEQMKNNLNYIEAALQSEGIQYFEHLESFQNRITWIAEDGNVLYDTQKDASTMENHKNRSEIEKAFLNGQGNSTRYSNTLTEKTIYYAKKLQDGTVLRISDSHTSVLFLAFGMLQPICIVIVIALVISAIMAGRMAKRIIEPMNHLNLEHPLENDTYEELAPLLRRIENQHGQINSQVRQLMQKNQEITQITENMKEGLVLLDEKGMIININPAAKKIFGTDETCEGKDFLFVDRSHDMSMALQKSMKEGHYEFHIERFGREYQIHISGIELENQTIGSVVLAFDITEQEFAERNRREFTANVSHELKTPLQTIIGSAELLENGLVKEEDTSRFVGHIKTEASRLVALIEDIIRLSQLDEGMVMESEEVDLFALAKEITVSLEDKAREKNIAIVVNGEPTPMVGVKRLLYEIIYNLCENAIKYNVTNGDVTILVGMKQEKKELIVRDTGIGIPKEHQPRIFERFYRVDKSHSKASGGTGLGLSIVKHGVAYHNGSIELNSIPNQETEIKIIFP